MVNQGIPVTRITSEENHDSLQEFHRNDIESSIRNEDIIGNDDSQNHYETKFAMDNHLYHIPGSSHRPLGHHDSLLPSLEMGSFHVYIGPPKGS